MAIILSILFLVWLISRRVIWIGHQWLFVDRADTLAAQEAGLGGRDSICAHCGMLFDFPRPDKYAFWMQGMRFPLDILWIANGRVVFIQKNISADSREIFVSPTDADQVLEINSGKADEWSIRIGERIQ